MRGCTAADLSLLAADQTWEQHPADAATRRPSCGCALEFPQRGYERTGVCHADGVYDARSWSLRVQASLDQLLPHFEDRFGLPPDDNVIVAASGESPRY